MTDREVLRNALEAARADLLATVEALPEDALTPALADLLWEVGRDEDWRRRALQHALEDRDVPAPDARPRPAYLVTAALLAEWLRQSQRPLLTLLRDLPAANLHRPVDTLEATPHALLEAIAARDREVTAHLRALPAPGSAR